MVQHLPVSHGVQKNLFWRMMQDTCDKSNLRVVTELHIQLLHMNWLELLPLGFGTSNRRNYNCDGNGYSCNSKRF
eukprot:3600986-Amphidinium_carterae.1